MARTKKGSKQPGEFWSRRPFSSIGYGKELKKLCHRAERRINADIIRQELELLN